MPSISPQLNLTDRVSISPTQIGSIAIIGGGASGAIISDTLLKETFSSFSNVTMFERRSVLGGIWALDKETIKTPNKIVTSGSDNYVTDPQLSNPFTTFKGFNKFLITKRVLQERFEHTPSYENITTNIIEKMMTYSDINVWSVDGDLKYVNGLVVQKYIDEYISRNLANNNFNLIQNATVEDVQRVTKPTGDLPYGFRLTIRQPLNDESDIWFQEDFDSVVVCTGHYHVPFIPYVEGLKRLQQEYDDVVQHAKFFRNSEPYKDKTIIVVGSRASGADLTKFIADTATTVYQSIRNSTIAQLSKKSNIVLKPQIKKFNFLPDSKGFSVEFDDGSEVLNPDHIIYATGYAYSYPFLNRLTNDSIITGSSVVSGLYKHTFLINEPLINFIGIPVDGISFRVFEYQAVVLSRYLAGKILLPSRNDQILWERQRLQEKGVTRAFHTIGFVDAKSFLTSLIELGRVENDKVNTGRQFPVLSVEDLEEYREAGELLRKFWDERI
jgi:hypothetical protein